MRNLLLKTSLLLAVLVPAAAHADTVYNAVSGFATGNQTGSPWVYGYGIGGSTFTAFGASGTAWNGNAGVGYWSNTTDGIPVVGYNSTGGTYSTTIAPSNTVLWLHPGDANDQDVIVQFIAPTTGYYTVSGLFQRADNTSGGDGIDYGIFLNGSQAESGSIGPLDTLAHTFSSPGAVLFTAGDIITFAVNRHGTVPTSYYYDSTGFDVTFTQLSVAPTPEPSSLMLLGTGMVGAVGFARRRFRK